MNILLMVLVSPLTHFPRSDSFLHFIIAGRNRFILRPSIIGILTRNKSNLFLSSAVSSSHSLAFAVLYIIWRS